jgi:tetratricopeptide (TPR) repeat protein
MRRWRLVLLPMILALALLTKSLGFGAVWLRNLAAVGLVSAWDLQRARGFEQVCQPAGRFPDIEGYLRAFLARMPTNSRVRTHLARIQWLQGDCEDAVQTWKESAAAHDLPAAFELFRIGDYDALPAGVRVQLADYAYARATDPRRNVDPQTMAAWLKRAFELVPQHRSATLLARMFRNAGDTPSLARLWQTMAERLPTTHADHWWAVAESASLDQQWAAAALAFTQGARLAVDPYDFVLRAGAAWVQVQAWPQAVAAYDQARQAHPDYVWPYLGLGSVYQGQKLYQEALSWYSQAKDLAPTDPAPDYYLGLTYYSMGSLTQARQSFEASLKSDPAYQVSMYGLAQIAHDEGNAELADQWMMEALDHALRSEWLSDWWLKLGDWRLEWHKCAQSREAYARARAAGASESVIEQKLAAFSDVCAP